jgi:hypothetical protein
VDLDTETRKAFSSKIDEILSKLET